jgi:hypothetical protein
MPKVDTQGPKVRHFDGAGTDNCAHILYNNNTLWTKYGYYGQYIENALLLTTCLNLPNSA